jgi:hypothetical protein
MKHMKLEAKSRLVASEDYGWYVLSESRKVLEGPFHTEAEAQRRADLHHSQELGIAIEYGCEENGAFESLSQFAAL